MAYTCPQDLDGFLPHLSKPDTKFRQTLGGDLLNFLADPSNPIHCQDIGLFVDSLIPWMQSSNYKVSCNGIEVMTFLADRLASDFRPYLTSVLPAVLDRLGDAKDTVREKAQLFLLKLLERNVLNPQHLFERLAPSLTHKNAKIREEVLRSLVNIINEHGSQSIILSKFIPDIVKLLSDSTSSVRDTAFSTIVELYKHIGERLRTDLQRKNLIPSAKLPALLAKFDEVRDSGELIHPAIAIDIDEMDRIAMPKPIVPAKRGIVLSASKRGNSAHTKSAGLNSALNSETNFNRFGSIRSSKKLTSVSKTDAGALDEESFLETFKNVPSVQLFSNRELTEQMNAIKDIISDTSKEWNKRVDALKKIRALLIAGAMDYEDFPNLVKNMEIALQTSVKDLRSQVVREACITISYLSQTMGSKFEHQAEFLLPAIINLIQNSAKVMATSGHICVRFIIQNTQSSRLIPIIIQNLCTHKSKDIRRSCCEFLETILLQWNTHTFEKHLSIIQDALKKGIADADPDARVISRRAFRAFKEHFPEQAEVLLQALDASHRKALYGELCLSSSSSSGSLAQPHSISSNSTYRPTRTAHRPPPSSGQTNATGSIENLSQSSASSLHRAPSLPRTYRQRSSIPVLNRDNSAKRGGFRSNSAIDLQAAHRAKVRAQYAATNRLKINSGTASLQGEVAQQARPKRHIESASVVSPERVSRSRARSSGVSQSQPTSRSGSPSSRIPYSSYSRIDHETPRPRRLSSGIPRSTTGSRDTSRETSPTRGIIRTLSSTRNSTRPPLSPATRPVMAQRILQQSLEAESALADALNYDSLDSADFTRLGSVRKTLRSLDNHSDDSETSSVCSERSFDSCRRPSDSYSWSGSQQRLSRDLWEPLRDINEIINNCASSVWQERKEGLLSLQYYLNNGKLLTKMELKQITEIFTKMFLDPHTKVLSLFLDTLGELITKHRTDLNDWLYVLLQRSFSKLGSDILNSLHKKFIKILDLVRVCFPADLQFAAIYRLLVDNTQTPNSKVKVAILSQLRDVAKTANASHFYYQPPASQALAKVVSYTQDPKSVEVRNAAKLCIITLFNCNAPQMMMLISELSKIHQEIASQLVQNHVRKSSTGSEPGSPIVGGSPKTLSPQTPNNPRDDLNQEEIYRSLRKTTAEIQNYSFEGLGITKLERDRDTTSQDSGISQMSAGGNDNRIDGVTSLEECMEELKIQRTNSCSGAVSSPNSKHPSITVSATTSNSLSYPVNGIINLESNVYTTDELRDQEVLQKLFNLESSNLDDTEIRNTLSQFLSLLKTKNVQHVTVHFKKVLKILLDYLQSSDFKLQMIVLYIFIEIFNNEVFLPCYKEYVELLLLKILCLQRESNKDVVRCAETCAAAMAVCPKDIVLHVLKPIIATSEYPLNLAGIKMLTKLVEHHAADISDSHLEQIMPTLIQAYDHPESSVRKCAVFCMVAIHSAVGPERMEPYLESLVGSKRKLLHLYVTRAQQGSSVPTSPKNSAIS